MSSDPPRPRVPASTVNPYAGNYDITGDPVEQAAAAAAAEQSWRAFPYYARRYGDRGWRFSLSDSGWLATLCDRPWSHAVDKLRWLQELLLARGMPSYLLERHLENLDAELARRAPDRGERHALVARLAAVLRDERTRVVADPEFRQLADAFDTSVADVVDRVPNMGAVLLSAAIDEAVGYVASLPAVEEWACDRARFSPAWVQAASSAIVAMRRSARAGA